MSFKETAKKYQKNYFGKSLNQSEIPKVKRMGRAQRHWLNEKAAKAGKNFYAEYDVFEKVKKSRGHRKNTPEWFYDTLRSQHIPFNFFVPLMKEQELAIALWSELLGITLDSITQTEIEFPSTKDNPLGDRTSFDIYIQYSFDNGKKGMIGIELKYTEGGYSPTDAEISLINEPKSVYYATTRASNLYNLNTTNINDIEHNYLRQNTYRQIWRNHLLAYTFARENNLDKYHSITLYHEGNTHFKAAFKKYDNFLSNEGKKTLNSITFSRFCQVLSDKVKTGKQKDWIKYLMERYDVVLTDNI